MPLFQTVLQIQRINALFHAVNALANPTFLRLLRNYQKIIVNIAIKLSMLTSLNLSLSHKSMTSIKLKIKTLSHQRQIQKALLQIIKIYPQQLFRAFLRQEKEKLYSKNFLKRVLRVKFQTHKYCLLISKQFSKKIHTINCLEKRKLKRVTTS